MRPRVSEAFERGSLDSEWHEDSRMYITRAKTLARRCRRKGLPNTLGLAPFMTVTPGELSAREAEALVQQ